MTSSPAMWEAWKLAKAYRSPPSEIYGIVDELAAWCFNRAVWYFGTTLEAELREAAEKAKNDNQARFRQQQVLSDWSISEMKFRDPAGSGGSAGKTEPRAGTPQDPQQAQKEVSSDTRGQVKL